MTPTIVRRNNAAPSTPVKTFSSWVDQMMQNNLSRFFNDDSWGLDTSGSLVNIPVNLRETDKTYEMELVAPGLKKEDFKLNVTNDMLTVAFEQKDEQQQENKEEGWLRREHKTQSFTRSFTLDDSVDVNNIKAAYSDGILRLTLPKKENAQRVSKAIEVK
jgi:HSP20 family protein